MASSGDNSYLITGKLCPPNLPMSNLTTDGWGSLTSSLLELIYTETADPGKQSSARNPLSALSFQASVWLSTDELSASSVVCLPYFFCNVCDYHTDSKAQLLRHAASKHIFKCRLCNFISVTRYDLVQHQILKHLDAKEVQPVLGCKNVYINLSILQRNLHLPQCDNSCNNLSSSSCGRDTPEIANSSQMDNSVICIDGLGDVVPPELRNQTQCLPGTGKEERRVTSSKCSLPPTGVNTPERNNGQKGQVVQTNSSSKRHLSTEELSDSQLGLKKLRQGICNENPTKILIASTPAHIHSFQMPHFLDKSDTNVTSSCSPFKNASPLFFERIKTEQLSPRKNQTKSHDTNAQVLSFLMEPTTTSAFLERTQSSTAHSDNSTSSTCTTPKSLVWGDDERDAATFKEAEPMSPFVSQAVPGYSRNVLSTFLKTSKEGKNENNHHSDLSQLGIVHVKQEPADVLDSLFLESCQELLDFSQDGGHVSLAGDSTPVNNYETPTRPYGASSETARSDNNSGRGQSGCHQISAQNMDNFLVTREDTVGDRKRVEKPQRGSDKKSDFEEHFVEVSNTGDEIKYDLLRKLLIGGASVKERAANAATVPGIDGKQVEALTSNEHQSSCPQASGERSESRNNPSLLARASDMSLKDLLTNSLDNIPSSVFYSCCYCGLKTSSKAELGNHVELCMNRDSDRVTTLHNNVYGLSGQAAPQPNYVHDASKTKATSSMDTLLDSLYSSDNFMASEVLKSLSEHYSESLSSEMSIQDKSNTPDREFQAGDVAQLKDQIYGLDPSESLDVNNKCLRHRPPRKKPEVDYNYESSDSSSSSSSESDSKPNSSRQDSDSDYMPNRSRRDSDSDYEPNSRGAAKKRTRRRQNTKHTLPLPKQSDSTKDCEIAQQLDPDQLPQKQPESSNTQYTCLYCFFRTCAQADMRHHLLDIHTENAPFAEMSIQNKGKTLIYFCKGVQSECSFSSTDSVAIFEHIKLCYCGYLDSFVYCDNSIIPDYSQALYSLGEASKCLDSTTVMFHCLRCQYSDADFQKLVSHVSTDHVYYVAGVLSVNKALKDPKVRMVCLVCDTHVPVKQWASHPCRKHFIDTDVTPSSRLEAQLKLSGTPGCKTSKPDENVRVSDVLDSSVIKVENFIDWKPNIGLGNSSTDYIQNQALSQIHSSNKSGGCNKGFTNDAHVKQEIPDNYFVEEKFADISRHLTQGQQAKTCSDMESKFSWRVNQTGNSVIDQQTNSASSAPTYSKSSGSSVLQSLLTAPRSAELVPRSAELLPRSAELLPRSAELVPRSAELLPRSAELVPRSAELVPRRAELLPRSAELLPRSAELLPRSAELVPKSQFSMLHTLLKTEHSLKETAQCKPFSGVATEVAAVPPTTHLQYPRIVDMLSRQDCSVPETYSASSISPSPKPTRQQTDKNHLDNSSLSEPISLPTAASLFPQIPPLQSHSPAFTKCFPNISVSTTNQPSSVSVHEAGSLPTLNPRPPQLPVPVIDLLPPSPALPLGTSFLNAGSQDVPGPFANLLRLLSKTQFNSDS